MKNTEQQHIDRCNLIIAEWFSQHTATQANLVQFPRALIVIDWRRPDTGYYAVRYIIDGHYVIVTGDLGDAIYACTQMLGTAVLEKMDWHYFVGKCVASETGRQYTQKVEGIKSPVPNIRAIAHHTGLMMALKQLKQQSPA